MKNNSNAAALPFSDITALILCGGKSLRMSGQDKGLLEVNGKPMIEHSIELLSGYFDDIIISSNQNVETYTRLGQRTIQDQLPDTGPLGGIQAAINNTEKPFLLVTPCDTPKISIEISNRLIHAARQSSALIHVAHDGNYLQMLHAILNLSSGKLKKSLDNYLINNRKVQLWYEQNEAVTTDCSDLPECFININTPEALIKISDK